MADDRTPEEIVRSIELCADGRPEEDHDWKYEGGEWDVGIPECWICARCGKIDADRPPESEDLDG